eukprot:SAG31_NODE_1130_length_9750_cov_9.716299_1_plen_64_part_00
MFFLLLVMLVSSSWETRCSDENGTESEESCVDIFGVLMLVILILVHTHMSMRKFILFFLDSEM